MAAKANPPPKNINNIIVFLLPIALYEVYDIGGSQGAGYPGTGPGKLAQSKLPTTTKGLSAQTYHSASFLKQDCRKLYILYLMYQPFPCIHETKR